MRHGEKDRERGMHLGGGARVILYRGGSRKEGAGRPTNTVGEQPKVKRRICAMELENAEGG